MVRSYQEFLRRKALVDVPTGLSDVDDINPALFDFQRDIVRWALRRGRAAIFADCGLGKTPMQLEWARHVQKHADGVVLILAPLAVAQQTCRECDKFGVDVSYVRSEEAITGPGIYITNYELIDRFSPKLFDGIVLDESSILKAFDGIGS